MQQLYPNTALIPILQRFLNTDLHFHITTVNTTYDDTVTLSTLAGGEPNWSGGSAPLIITVAASDFTLTGVTGGRGTVQASTISFQNTSGSTSSIYAYYVTDTTDSILLAVAELDSAPVAVPNNGYFYVVPIFGNFSQY